MTLLQIEGYSCPAPTEYSVLYSDIDSSDTGRGETGVLYRDRIRAGVAKISVSWTNLTQAQTDALLNAVSGESLSVTYYFGTEKTAAMYVGDRTLELAYMGTDGARYRVGFDLVEF